MIMINLDNMVKLQKVDDKSCDLYLTNNQRICLNVRFEEIQEMLDSNRKFLFVENTKRASGVDDLPPLPPPAPPPPKEIGSGDVITWKLVLIMMISCICVLLCTLLFR